MAIALTGFQLAVLFWVFLAFFVVIGVFCLLVVLGFVRRADPTFRKWAGRGFIAAVAGVVIALFKVSFTEPSPPPAPPPPILVTLMPADGQPFNVEKGAFEYGEQQPAPADGAKPLSTDVIATLEPGGYQVQLPGELANKPIKLTFKDTKTADRFWETGLFYPNKTQQAVRTGQQSPPQLSRSVPSPFAVVLAATTDAAQDAKRPQQAPPKFDNYARQTGTRYGQKYFDWRVFVDEPPAVLGNIQQVDYLLHSSFPDPFRTTRDRDKKFEVAASGWGEFAIVITVHFTNGAIAKTSYQLNLSKGWPGMTGTGAGGGAAAARPRLDKIRVVEDGSAAATGWVFDIQVDGSTVMSLPKVDYDNSTNRADVVPDTSHRWLSVNLQPGRKVRIDVKGRRTSGGDTAVGTAMLGAGETVTIPVKNATSTKKGSFVFSFSTGTPPA